MIASTDGFLPRLCFMRCTTTTSATTAIRRNCPALFAPVLSVRENVNEIGTAQMPICPLDAEKLVPYLVEAVACRVILLGKSDEILAFCNI